MFIPKSDDKIKTTWNIMKQEGKGKVVPVL
jgi:hypothetical protein